MKESQFKLSLDRPTTYIIKVPGHLDEGWSEWDCDTTIELANESDGTPTTILTSTLDQAGLHGLLRQLYSRGLPLISVLWQGSG